MTHDRELSPIELIDGASHATREKIPDSARFYLIHRGEKKWFKPGTRVHVVWEDEASEKPAATPQKEEK